MAAYSNPATTITVPLNPNEAHMLMPKPCAIDARAPDNCKIASYGTNAITPLIAPVSNGRCVGPAVLPCARIYCKNEESRAISSDPKARCPREAARPCTFESDVCTPEQPLEGRG